MADRERTYRTSLTKTRSLELAGQPGPKSIRFGFSMLFASIELMGAVVVSGVLYPGYSITQDYVSDLGAPISSLVSKGGVDAIKQPSSAILVLSFLLFGSSMLWSAMKMRRLSPSFGSKWLPRLLLAYSAGALLVAASYIPFYAYAGSQVTIPAGASRSAALSAVPPALIAGLLVHLAGAWVVLLAGPLAIVVSSSLARSNRYARGLLVAAGLAMLSLSIIYQGSSFNFGLGPGGFERVALYPVWLWVAGLGLFAVLRHGKANV